MPEDFADTKSASKTTTFRAYAKALDIKLPDGTPLGDHTWTSTDEADICWSALGSSDKEYYCGSKRWSSGKYKAPGGSRTLPESGKGSIKKAEFLGNPKRTTFMKIPSSAGIVYAVHGVCHEITNRIMYHTGATVRGASQYNVTKAFYGVYGTSIPAFVWMTPLAPVATTLQFKILWDWRKRIKKSGRLKMLAPAADASLFAIDDLHEQLSGTTLTSRGAQIDAHQTEMAILLRRELGEAVSDSQIAAMGSVYEHLESKATIPQVASDTVPITAEPEFDPTDLAMSVKPHVTEAMNGFADALGTENYTKFFGQKPEEYVSFINPEMFKT